MDIEQLVKILKAENEKLVIFVLEQTDTTCDECKKYSGRIYRESDPSKPKLPIHPNCRCTYEVIYHPSGQPGEIEYPPVLKGYEASRFQEHDERIAQLAADFNANIEYYAGCTPEQAKRIPPITPAFLKSWFLQETGGNEIEWRKDPGQANNVSKDWDDRKTEIGLREFKDYPVGTDVTMVNMRASLMWLVRKGFGTSAQPARNWPSGFFDGWEVALHRYNVNRTIRSTGNPHYKEYAKRIFDRASDMTNHYPIEIR